MKKDISNKEDIILLVDSFYEKVKTDPVIGYIFTEVRKVNWEKHLPRMYDFWENTLFYTGGYVGNPMQTHQRLANQVELSNEQFKRWLDLFTGTVDKLFEGKTAALAKQRALSISTVMQIKIIKQPANEEKNDNGHID